MQTIRRGVTALLAILLAALYLPFAHAEDSRFEISSGHTDGFYVSTDTGTPVVKVANGLGNTLYDPNSVYFAINSSTYGTNYEFSSLDRSSSEGYYTASWEASHYFEPGWSAPGYRDNGFSSVRIDFTEVTGPAPFAVLGNDPMDEEDEFATVPFLSDGKYYLEAGTSLPILGHTHAHWFFEHSGTYTLTGHAVAVTADGREVESAPFTEVFQVEKHEDDTRADLPVITLGTPAEEHDHGHEHDHDHESIPGHEHEHEHESNPGHEHDHEHESTPGHEHEHEDGHDHGHEHDHGHGQPLTDPTTISAGHVDLFNVSAEDGTLQLALNDGTSGHHVLRAPESVTMVIGPSALTSLPASRAQKLAPTGYLISENGTEQETLPFMGWDTSAVAPDFEAIDLKVLEVTGPGSIFMFKVSPFQGMTSPFTNGDYRVAEGSVLHQANPGHAHTNWLFTEAGTYTLKIQASGTPHDGDSPVTSNISTYTFTVGETASAPESQEPQPEQEEAKAPLASPSAEASPSAAEPVATDATTVASAPSAAESAAQDNQQGQNIQQGQKNEQAQGKAAASPAASALAHTGSNLTILLVLGALLSLGGIVTVLVRRTA
ncbi:MAG: choice-of-anchor M domain-containing protein [Rothia sp. (in: high G+C Gram-positive bacteria)]|nr:choice-of-anchor M domain-containing protein [Rothia sp. (in: high G+C Gram-positive bacteria)]